MFEHHLHVYYLFLLCNVNGAKFLNVNFLLVLFIVAHAAAVFGTVIIPLTSMHAFYNHKFDLNRGYFRLNLSPTSGRCPQ